MLTLKYIDTDCVLKILNDTTDVTSRFTSGANGIYKGNVGGFSGSEKFSLTAIVTDADGNTSATSNISFQPLQHPIPMFASGTW